jgi:hypothetical protein
LAAWVACCLGATVAAAADALIPPDAHPLGLRVVSFAMPDPAADSTAMAARPAAQAESSALLRSDRLQHLTLAFSIGLAAGVAADDATVGGAAALGLGLAKELWDARDEGTFDGWDLLADAIGAALAVAAVHALTR